MPAAFFNTQGIGKNRFRQVKKLYNLARPCRKEAKTKFRRDRQRLYNDYF